MSSAFNMAEDQISIRVAKFLYDLANSPVGGELTDLERAAARSMFNGMPDPLTKRIRQRGPSA